MGLRPAAPALPGVDAEALAQRIAGGASIAFIGGGIGNGFSLGLQVLLGRMLGPRAYGLFFLGFSLLNTLQWVASLGLDWGVLRFCAQYRGIRQEGYVKGTLFAAVVGSGISSVVIGVAWFTLAHRIGVGLFHDAAFGPVLRLFAVALPLYVLVRILAAFMQALNHLLPMAILQDVLPPAIALVLGAILLAQGGGVQGAVAAWIAALVATVLVGLRYVVRLFPDARSALPLEYAPRELLAYSTRLMLLGLAWQLFLRIDSLILGYFADPRTVGIYGAAATSALVLTTVAVAFSASMAPIMADLYHRRRIGDLRALYRTITRWNLILTAALVPAVFFLAGTVMRVFGKEFVGADPVLWLLALSWLFYFSKGPSSTLMDMTGWQTVNLINTIAACMLVGILSLWLIPAHGMMGAALAAMTIRLLLSIVEAIEIYVLFQVIPFGWYALPPILAAGALMLGEYLALSHVGPVVAVAMGSGVYAVFCWRYCLSRADQHMVKSLWRKLLFPRPSGVVTNAK